MNKIKNLYDAGIVADEALAALTLTMSALTVTLESMDNDGIQPEGERSASYALNFAARFPMYSDTLHLILASLMDTLAALQTGTDAIFEAHRNQMRTKETTE